MAEEKQNTVIKEQILEALAHPEAEEGLYLDNLHHLHEEDERRTVQGSEADILEALKELIQEGKVTTEGSGPMLIFHLSSNGSA